MSSVDFATYKDLYLKTAREHIADLKKNLDQLNLDLTNPKLIYEIFRLFHSLKSQNYFMGFEKTAYLCHALEKYFHTIKDGQRTYAKTISHIIFAGIHKLENSVETIERENKEADLSEEIAKLKSELTVDISS